MMSATRRYSPAFHNALANLGNWKVASLSRGHSRERAADDVADETARSFDVTILRLWFRALANNRLD